MKKVYHHKEPFVTESGSVIPSLEIAYHTYGTLAADCSNVIWIFHALTADSDPASWWSGLVGEDKYFTPEKHFIVCANIIGSCYGSSGPLSINPVSGKSYYSEFPIVTVRDMVKAHKVLQQFLGIKRIYAGAGGSMGGYQLLEWAAQEPELFDNIILLATSAKESAWGIAVHTAQRMAIESDPTWKDASPEAGKNGLMAARAIGMLTYRNYETFVKTQSDTTAKTNGFRAESYIRYQGEKLKNRFNAQSYYLLTQAMDSHDLGRGRDDIDRSAKKVLNRIKAKTVIIGITSDILCPPQEQKYLADNIPNTALHIIDSPYGHDGFLIEYEKINEILKNFISGTETDINDQRILRTPTKREG